MSDHSDILFKTRPQKKHPPMDIAHRAKQFAPFAALKGFESCVKAKEILYEEKAMLSEERKEEIDGSLQQLSVGRRVLVTYYEESSRIPGKGLYHTISGEVEFWKPDLYLRIEECEILPENITELEYID